MGIENDIQNLQSKVSTIEEFLEDLASYSSEVIAEETREIFEFSTNVPSEEIHAEFIKIHGNLGEIICRLAEFCSAHDNYWD